MTYFFKLGFDFNTHTFNTEVVPCDDSDKLQWFYKHIDTDTIDIVRITESIDIVVDDNGLLFSGKPVFEIIHQEFPNRPLQLAGILLFGKNKFIEDEGMEVIGFSTEKEAIEFASRLKIKLIGITN